jgi:hypothetical protein
MYVRLNDRNLITASQQDYTKGAAYGASVWRRLQSHFYLVYAARLSASGLEPVVVRDSTCATVYALFSAFDAASRAASSGNDTPRANAKFVILAVMRSTVMAR